MLLRRGARHQPTAVLQVSNDYELANLRAAKQWNVHEAFKGFIERDAPRALGSQQQ
jgi:hypothetical protein